MDDYKKMIENLKQYNIKQQAVELDRYEEVIKGFIKFCKAKKIKISEEHTALLIRWA